MSKRNQKPSVFKISPATDKVIEGLKQRYGVKTPRQAILNALELVGNVKREQDKKRGIKELPN